MIPKHSILVPNLTMSFPFLCILVLVITCSFACDQAHGQLSPRFYSRTCPPLKNIVYNVTTAAVAKERRLAASLLRLFFHDCFVNGCDGSILLDDTATLKSERTALVNENSVRGFEVIDAIKEEVELACKETVSCADILALAAVEGLVAIGGPRWKIDLGRRDARTTSKEDAENQMPLSFEDLPILLAKFAAKNLDARDMTVLSGAHTIGFARCGTFRPRIYNDTNIDPHFAAARKASCPNNSDDHLLTMIDATPFKFDNAFFKSLIARKGLFHSDQELFNGGSQDALVKKYSKSTAAFFRDFKASMEKMSNLSPLTGSNGEIRRKCQMVN